ncbi:MAG: PQQ-like beta-propeller repeat protein [Pirellulales bacterium]
MPFVRIAFSWLLCAMLAEFVAAEEWPCWRGPRGDGTSSETNLPTTWSATENVVWKTPLTIAGHSSPVTYGERVFIAGADETKPSRELAAYDRATGKPLWSKVVVESPLEKKHKLNSYASGTPAVDAERIYVSFLDKQEMVVAAFSHTGEDVWSVRPGAFSSVHGFCSSPVLYKNLVIVNGDHDGDAYLVALDRKTGETVWKTSRENKTRSYCTPIVREVEGRPLLMLSGSKCVAAFDPETGKRRWILDGPTEQFVASPVYMNGLLYITGGFPDKHIIAIDPRGEGKLPESAVVWHHLRRGVSYVPSPVAVDDYFLITSDEGIASCFDAANGKLLWQERMGRHYSGSLIAAGGLVYATDDDGVTKILKPGSKPEILATNKLEEEVYSSLAPSNGKIFIRGAKHLWCVGKVD